jgi:hypothetical protein
MMMMILRVSETTKKNRRLAWLVMMKKSGHETRDGDASLTGSSFRLSFTINSPYSFAFREQTRHQAVVNISSCRDISWHVALISLVVLPSLSHSHLVYVLYAISTTILFFVHRSALSLVSRWQECRFTHKICSHERSSATSWLWCLLFPLSLFDLTSLGQLHSSLPVTLSMTSVLHTYLMK